MGLMIAEVNGRGIVHFWVQDWAEDYWTGEATGLPSIPVARDWGRLSGTNDADLVINTIKMIPDEKMDIAEHLASYVSKETGQRIWDASTPIKWRRGTPEELAQWDAEDRLNLGDVSRGWKVIDSVETATEDKDFFRRWYHNGFCQFR
jgi:hypothetical protein